jgi:hypothetical protein
VGYQRAEGVLSEVLDGRSTLLELAIRRARPGPLRPRGSLRIRLERLRVFPC